MAATRVKVAKLDKARLTKLREVERELGCVLLALEPEFRLADLSAKQIQKLRAAEKKLGVILLAYDAD